MNANTYAKRMASWGGTAPRCSRCGCDILPGELKRYTQGNVSEHEYALQCVRAKAHENGETL